MGRQRKFGIALKGLNCSGLFVPAYPTNLHWMECKAAIIKMQQGAISSSSDQCHSDQWRGGCYVPEKLNGTHWLQLLIVAGYHFSWKPGFSHQVFSRGGWTCPHKGQGFSRGTKVTIHNVSAVVQGISYTNIKVCYATQYIVITVINWNNILITPIMFFKCRWFSIMRKAVTIIRLLTPPSILGFRDNPSLRCQDRPSLKIFMIVFRERCTKKREKS